MRTLPIPRDEWSDSCETNEWYKIGAKVKITKGYAGIHQRFLEKLIGTVVLTPWQLTDNDLHAFRGLYLTYWPGFGFGHRGVPDVSPIHKQVVKDKINNLLCDSITKHNLLINLSELQFGKNFYYLGPRDIVLLKGLSDQQYLTIDQLVKNFDLLKDKYE